jgi:hypothetical protein
MEFQFQSPVSDGEREDTNGLDTWIRDDLFPDKPVYDGESSELTTNEEENN